MNPESHTTEEDCSPYLNVFFDLNSAPWQAIYVFAIIFSVGVGAPYNGPSLQHHLFYLTCEAGKESSYLNNIKMIRIRMCLYDYYLVYT